MVKNKYYRINENDTLDLLDCDGEIVKEGCKRTDGITYGESPIDKFGYVYITVCENNNIAYIGRHKVTGKKYLGSGVRLKRAVKKYGLENFKSYILEFAESSAELNELESAYLLHKLGLDIEEHSVLEFYNLKTKYTEDYMEKQVEEYEKKMKKAYENVSEENHEVVRIYEELNIIYNKEKTIRKILKIASSPEDNEIKNMKHTFNFEGLDINNIYSLITDNSIIKMLPDLHETMYKSIYHEILSLDKKLIRKFTKENRYVPFQNYIFECITIMYSEQGRVLEEVKAKVKKWDEGYKKARHYVDNTTISNTDVCLDILLGKDHTEIFNT